MTKGLRNEMCDDVRQVIVEHSRSFSLATRFLPVRIRDQVRALYAWCRAVDDCVDRADSPQSAAEDLEKFRHDLATMRDGGSSGQTSYTQPASYWIEGLVVERRIDPKHAFDLLEGMQMDLENFQVRSEADLRHYCYHAAGCVGLMLSSLMGVRHAAARRHAISLGIAMQMTNIARDVREDADAGRCYVPGLDLESAAGNHSQTRKAVKLLLRRAETEYEQANEGIRYLPRDCRMAIRVALAAYREIGREILRRDAAVWEGRTVVPKGKLLLTVGKALFPMFDTAAFTRNFERLKMQSETSTNKVRQSLHAVYLGLSLTSFMAAALFMLVYVNPKDESYGLLPVIYAGVAMLVGLATNLLARKQERGLSR